MTGRFQMMPPITKIAASISATTTMIWISCARSRRGQPDLPVMMVTAYDDDERRRRANDLGAAQFITKPVDFDLLRAQ